MDETIEDFTPCQSSVAVVEQQWLVAVVIGAHNVYQFTTRDAPYSRKATGKTITPWAAGVHQKPSQKTMAGNQKEQVEQT